MKKLFHALTQRIKPAGMADAAAPAPSADAASGSAPPAAASSSAGAPQHSILALRHRPPGAAQFETSYPLKNPTFAPPMLVQGYPDGRRLITQEGMLHTVVCDVDVVDYVVDQVWISSAQFTSADGFVARFTARSQGVPLIQHGTLLRGLTTASVIQHVGQYDAATETYRARDRLLHMLSDTVHVFQTGTAGTGFVATLPLLRYLPTYNPAAWQLVQELLPPALIAAALPADDATPDDAAPPADAATLHAREAAWDWLVYYAYGPGHLVPDLHAALAACGPGWHRLDALARHLPTRTATAAHRNAVWIMLQEGTVLARPNHDWPQPGASQEFCLP